MQTIANRADLKGGLRILIKKPLFTQTTHPSLREIVEKVYAFRGDQAAHAKPEGSNIEREESELIISLTAGIITYLATKFELNLATVRRHKWPLPQPLPPSATRPLRPPAPYDAPRGASPPVPPPDKWFTVGRVGVNRAGRGE